MSGLVVGRDPCTGPGVGRSAFVQATVSHPPSLVAVGTPPQTRTQLGVYRPHPRVPGAGRGATSLRTQVLNLRTSGESRGRLGRVLAPVTAKALEARRCEVVGWARILAPVGSLSPPPWGPGGHESTLKAMFALLCGTSPESPQAAACVGCAGLADVTTLPEPPQPRLSAQGLPRGGRGSDM